MPVTVTEQATLTVHPAHGIKEPDRHILYSFGSIAPQARTFYA